MPLVRRRPLLRAAAVGGGAYYMGKRRQQAKEQQGEQQQQPAAAGAQGGAPRQTSGEGASSDTIERLAQLGKLHEQGVLTDEEFTEQKTKLLNG